MRTWYTRMPGGKPADTAATIVPASPAARRGGGPARIVELDKVLVLDPDPELQRAGVFGAKNNTGGSIVRGFGVGRSKRGLKVWHR
jgi:hypothetical protein